MAYVSRELLRLALQYLARQYSPLLTISLPCMLSHEIPTARTLEEAQQVAIRFGSRDEKAWLESEMQKEKNTLSQHRSFSVLQTLVNWRVLALAAIHFGQAGVSVGLAVFIAQIIKGLGLTNMQTGFTTAIPYIAELSAC